MSRAKKIDANQPEIVELFRELGCQVAVTSAAGGGFPDIVVQYHDPFKGRTNTYLVEIKDGSLSPSRRKLTPDQEEFHSVFKCEIVEYRSDVFELLGMIDPDGKRAD